MEVTMARMTRPINIQLVAGGSVTMVVLNVPNRRKSSTRGHALLSQAGQISGTPNIRRGDLFSNSAGFRVRRSRCNHSDSRGRGQTVHQILPPRGTSRIWCTVCRSEEHTSDLQSLRHLV